jgi:hypothetical protein
LIKQFTIKDVRTNQKYLSSVNVKAHKKKLAKVITALDTLLADTEVPVSVTLESLKEIKDRCRSYIDAIQETR